MKHLLLLFVLLSFSCKKEGEKPVAKQALFEIEYTTWDNEMNTWYNIGNELVENSHKDTNYVKFSMMAKGGEVYHASIQAVDQGSNGWNKILIKFNGDTVVYNNEMADFSLEGTLPIIP